MCTINKKSLLLFFLFSSFILSAQSVKEKAIKEITKAENDFSVMAAEKGIEAAFVHFAAPDAIIKRGNDSLIFGISGIANFYAKDVFKKAQLKWSPDFTDASESGDMGYTYGKYTWQLKDDQGKIIQEANGIFHSVWKKQKDGSWKFVWD
jgi:ketosteroid isomerase-like protein